MFEDREDAGKKLALEVKGIIKNRDFVVAALLRGGVILGKEISDYFKVPLYPLAIRKIGAPYNPELAIGAIGPEKTIYWDEGILRELKVEEGYKTQIVKAKSKEVEDLEKMFLNKKERVNFGQKKVLLVDDGVATGSSAICGSIFLKKEKAKEIILAVPVIARDILRDVNKYFDRVIALNIVENLGAVGEFYRYFPQLSNEDILSRMV